MKLSLQFSLTAAYLLASSVCKAAQDGEEGRRKLGALDSMLDFISPLIEFPRTDDVPKEKYDVIIIGAGMAGLAAAAELKAIDPDISYIILESTDRIGGRVRSATNETTGMNYTVEDGAVYLYDNNNYAPWMKALEIGLEYVEEDTDDSRVFDETGMPANATFAEERADAMEKAFRDAIKDANAQFSGAQDDSFVDNGIIGLLSNNGWTVASDASGNMDYLWQWTYVDYEYGKSDSSQLAFPPEILSEAQMVTDQRGFEYLLQKYQEDNIPSDKIKLNTRVRAINYDFDICDSCRICGRCTGKTYRVVVNTDETEYLAQRVINTVSVGVHNNNLISYSPALKYSPEEYNPYMMAQSIKVYYQFDEQFWDFDEFLYMVLDVADRGKCNQWQLLSQYNNTGLEGSLIIKCELETEAFEELLAGGTELSAATLDGLLDPLRLAYGAANVPAPIATYYPKLNLDADWGYGAFGNWQVGKTFTDFGKFFGGVEELARTCDHNGCNSNRGWVVHFSGAASCYEHGEYVHGAYFAGQRSARFVMDSLGYSVVTDKSECDVSFKQFGFSPMKSTSGGGSFWLRGGA